MTENPRRPLHDVGDPADRFSLVAGGPFYNVLRRLRLIGADQLPLPRAGFALAVLAWLPPALLAIAQSAAEGARAVETQSRDWLAMGGWLTIVLVVFLGPLLVFVGPLHALRERALLDYGLANQ